MGNEEVFDIHSDKNTSLELEQRVTVAQNVCQHYSLTSQSINSKEFYVDHEHHLVWCNIFKAGSSYWLYKFNILAGYDKKFLSKTRQLPLMLARKKFPRPSEEELKDAIADPGVTSLLIVRDPFVRLLSAFRDKLENNTRPLYRNLAKRIIKEHRQQATEIFGPIKSRGPTFYEFVAYLIKKNKEKDYSFDEHWSPYYQFCSPCAVNFTVIAKVETLARDSAFLIRDLGLEHVLGKTVKDRRIRDRIVNKSRDGKNTTTLLKGYFKQLDQDMLSDLLRIYGIDFEMFGYDTKIYRSYVRD
ncbi:carbohydrate sulfotransferase 11 isoform X2 [Pectinophora gossypiella]|nr:carbohydrate sulfotransferase 11 isoform X2 [Pectinophora gossypiella]